MHVRRSRWPIALLLIGISLSSASAADVLSQLGITPQAAREAVGSVITGGIFNPGLPTQAFKLLPPSARAEAARAGVACLKAYVSTPEFRDQYVRVRDRHRPEPPAFAGTPEDELKREIEEQKQQAEESRKVIASLPPDQRKALEQTLEETARALAQMDTPEMRKQRVEAIAAARAERTARYQQDVAGWQREYPDNPNGAIAKRLREFLAVSADVDFDAQLKTEDGRSTFVNPAYQAKPAQWKMCFRAGREATMAARAAVAAWLSEL